MKEDKSYIGELDEAATEYARTKVIQQISQIALKEVTVISQDKFDAFKAGAEWQRQRDQKD